MQLDISCKGIKSLKEYFSTCEGNIDDIIELDIDYNNLTTLLGFPKNVRFVRGLYTNNLIELYGNSFYTREINEINSKIDNFIKSVKCIKSFDKLKNFWLQDFYKPDGMYVQLTDKYFI